VDLYLSVPIESEGELNALARAANLAADRMIKRLDETIAYVDHVLKHKRNDWQSLTMRSTGAFCEPRLNLN